METVSYLGVTLLRWRVGSSTFLARPEAGARLMAWHLTHADGTERDVLHWPELTSLAGFAKVRGGNPILFPFSARTFLEGEQNFWRVPHLGERRPMPMHGFARTSTFTLLNADQRGFEARLVPDATTREAYPYDYEFTVAYRFAPLALVCELSLTNLGATRLPWSAGHHFYFTLPWHSGAYHADYRIQIPATRRHRHGPIGHLDPGPALGRETTFADPALHDTIHTGLTGAIVSFGPTDGPSRVTVRHGVADVPPPGAAFVTWTENSTSPFYCVEPWMGPPNAPEHGIGLHWVEPGQTSRFTVQLGVS
jgi:galactose mutarotase-like enzyme